MGDPSELFALPYRLWNLKLLKKELEVTIQEAMAANLGSWINYAYIVEKRPSTGTCPCTLPVPLRYVYFIQQPRFASMSLCTFTFNGV